MRCLKPRSVGFQDDGKTISWSEKKRSKEYPIFALPCGKCIECRLEYARSWAIRCVHESKMHEKNSFITLTYSDEHLKSPKLEYRDFQLFAKRLRKKIHTDFIKSFGKYNWSILSESEKKEYHERNKIGIFVTGEYGDLRKRPHWHAIIFNWEPGDQRHKYTNHSGDRVYDSNELTDLWGHGIAETGSVTFHSAGYVARYAAKKLVHGKDDEHDFHPISKKSSKQAIGKSFLEKFWPDIFNYGKCRVPGGQEIPIPRYYEKWLQKNHPTEWERYVTQLKNERSIRIANEKALADHQAFLDNLRRGDLGKDPARSQNEVRTIITEERFQRLQSHLKGDI